MMARSRWSCIVMTRTWWCRRWSIMKTRIWWVWWLLWQEHIVMHLIPLSLAHRQQWVRGLQWCRLSRQHQSLQQPKYSIFFKFHKFWICPPCLGPWPPRGAEGLRWHHQMTQTFKFWNSQAKDVFMHFKFLLFYLLISRKIVSLTCQFFWRQLLYRQVQSCMQCSLPTIH